jgi:hypothetical protein
MSREWSLSRHTCCDTGLQFVFFNFFVLFRRTYRPFQSLRMTLQGMWKIYSNPDYHVVSLQPPLTPHKGMLSRCSYSDHHGSKREINNVLDVVKIKRKKYTGECRETRTLEKERADTKIYTIKIFEMIRTFFNCRNSAEVFRESKHCSEFFE